MLPIIILLIHGLPYIPGYIETGHPSLTTAEAPGALGVTRFSSIPGWFHRPTFLYLCHVEGRSFYPYPQKNLY